MLCVGDPVYPGIDWYERQPIFPQKRLDQTSPENNTLKQMLENQFLKERGGYRNRPILL